MPGAQSGLTKFIKQGVQFLATKAAATYFAVKATAAPSANITVLTPTTPPPDSTDQVVIFNGTAAAGYQARFANVPSGGGGSLVDVAVATTNITTWLTVAKTGTTSLSFTLDTPATTVANQFLASPNGSAGRLTVRGIAAADIPKTLDNTWITDFNTQVRASRLDQMALPTAAVAFNAQKITGLADGTNNQDAVTFAQLQAAINQTTNKGSVKARSATNITLATPGSTFNGVTLTGTGTDLLLLTGQTTASENGLYVWNGASTPLTRATNADTSAEVRNGLFVFVSPDSTGWTLVTPDPIVLGTTALNFQQSSGAGQITAGAGLTKTGDTLDVVGTSNRISVAADSIDISSAYVGQSSITTVGTITTGVWNGTAIPIAYGGTGATTAVAARAALGVPAVAKGTFTNANLVSGTLTIIHNLNLATPFMGVLKLCDENREAIAFPDTITFTDKDTVTVDLNFAGTITGTWGYIFVAA